MLQENTTITDYIEFTREPFEDIKFKVVLQDGQSFEIDVLNQKKFFSLRGLTVPEKALDYLFNFNIVRWWPGNNRIEIL